MKNNKKIYLKYFQGQIPIWGRLQLNQKPKISVKS